MKPKAIILIMIGVVVSLVLVSLAYLKISEDRGVEAPMENSQTDPVKSTSEELVIESVTSVDITFTDDDPYATSFNLIDGEIVWTSVGSSGCPPIIVVALYSSVDEFVTLVEKDYEGQMCTMDLKPVQQRIKLANGEKLPEGTTISVTKDRL